MSVGWALAERTHPTVTTVKMVATSPEWEQWFLLRSDAHHDNTHCQHDLEQRHLVQARDRGAGILDFGDAFCAMQGKWDKRADWGQFRPELRVPNYLDQLVAYNASFYEPFAAHWVLLTWGNHEGSILERHQTNLTERLAERLRAQGGAPLVGTYQGWVRFMFRFHKTKTKSIRLRYTHGYGGGGPVTKDVIQAHRQMAMLGNADIVVSGHTHDAWQLTHVQESLNDLGVPVLTEVECIKCGGYKDEYSGGKGWAVSKGFPPKPLGGYWLRFFIGAPRGEPTICFETMRTR